MPPSAREPAANLERIAALLRDRCGAVRFGAPVAFEYTLECLAIEAYRYLQGETIMAVLDELALIWKELMHMRVDNGPEMLSNAVKA